MRGNLPQDPAYRMRAIRRFPPPDSHVSLSAVLEPGPDAQTTTPPHNPPRRQATYPKNKGRRTGNQLRPTRPGTTSHHDCAPDH
jgi:hypothetical protein